MVAWDALADLWDALGLVEFVEVQDIQDFVATVEEIVEDPEASLSDYIGINITDVTK